MMGHTFKTGSHPGDQFLDKDGKEIRTPLPDDFTVKYDDTGESRFVVQWKCKACNESFNDRRPQFVKIRLCEGCAWTCPKCDGIGIAPEDDYLCEDCRYG